MGVFQGRPMFGFICLSPEKGSTQTLPTRYVFCTMKNSISYFLFVSEPTCVISLTSYATKTHNPLFIFTQVGLLIFFKKKHLLKSVLTNVKSLSVQVTLDFPSTTFLIFLLPLGHIPRLLANVPLRDSAGTPALDENFHHLPIRELGLVEQAAHSAFVVR